jgi:hypothetical protein
MVVICLTVAPLGFVNTCAYYRHMFAPSERPGFRLRRDDATKRQPTTTARGRPTHFAAALSYVVGIPEESQSLLFTYPKT